MKRDPPIPPTGALYLATFASLLEKDSDPRTHAARLRFLEALADELPRTSSGQRQPRAARTFGLLIREVIDERLRRYDDVVLDRRRLERREQERRSRERRAA